MDLLARREHGSKELASKLATRFRRRDCAPDLIATVVEQLIDEGLLSDARYAASTVRQMAGRGYGPARIKASLRQSGIEDELPEGLDSAFDQPVDWASEAAAAYAKKYRGAPIAGDWDARQRERAKRLRFLQYRGFDAEVSQRLVSADDTGDVLNPDS